MGGRGRGRLWTSSKEPVTVFSQANSSLSADIRELFNVKRSTIEVYKILKSFIFAKPFNKSILRTCLERLVQNMINNSTNTAEICKILYVCSCSTEKNIGNEVWSQFYNILEFKFKEIRSDENVNEMTLRNFIKFFIVAINYMRDPMEPPKSNIISANLILINRLNTTHSEDRHIFCQAVAWISSYMNYSERGSILHQAFTEAVNQLREMILQGSGGHWGLACLEAACNGGILPHCSMTFYEKTLSQTQFVNLTEASRNILIPAAEKGNYNLPNIEYIHYID